MFLKNEFSNRLVQVSIFSAIVYYVTTYPVVFEKARKYFPIKFKKDHHQLLFHTFVFAVLMYLLTYYVFDPVVRVVEGTGGHCEPAGWKRLGRGHSFLVSGADQSGAAQKCQKQTEEQCNAMMTGEGVDQSDPHRYPKRRLCAWVGS